MSDNLKIVIITALFLGFAALALWWDTDKERKKLEHDVKMAELGYYQAIDPNTEQIIWRRQELNLETKD